MSYSSGGIIQASDFNTFAGSTSVAAASSAAAQNTAGYLYGVGYGDRGYGQNVVTLSPKVAGQTIDAADWYNIRSILSTLSSHQGLLLTMPPVASSGTSIAYSQYYSTALSALDGNRFATNSGGSMSLTSNALVQTRGSAWGGGGNTGISSASIATFASEDAARYFFNSGGEIRLSLSHPSGSAQDINWNSGLANIGTIAFRAHGTTRSGTYTTPYSIGYYELTTANQVILSGVVGTSVYSANTVTVYARANAITGANGAKGYQIIFTVVLQDAHINPFYDGAVAGTTVTYSHLRSSAFVNVAGPTITQLQAWL